MRETKVETDGSKAAGVEARGVIWTYAIVMAICFVGLTHSSEYLAYSAEVSIEHGESLGDRAEFEKDVNAAPLYRKAAFGLIILVGGFAAITAPRDRYPRLCGLTLIAGCFLVWTTASLLWAVEAEKCSRELIRVAAYLLVAYGVTRRFKPSEVCLIVGSMMCLSIMVAFGIEVVLGKFKPWYADYRLGGTLHTNTLSSHAAVLTIVAFCFQSRSSRPWLLRSIVVSALAIILLTKTRGSLATAMFGIGASFFAGRRPLTIFVVGSLCLALVSLLGFAIMSDSGPMADLLLLGRSDDAVTLTGRTPLWEVLWDETEGRRTFGFGFGAFWITEQLEALNDEVEWHPGHSHNAFLQTILDTGFIGLGMALLVAFLSIQRASLLFRSTSNPAFAFCFAYIASGFVDGCLEVSVIYPRALGLISAIAVGILAVAPTRRQDASTDQAESLLDKTPATVA